MFYNNPTFTDVTPKVVGAGGQGSILTLNGDGLFPLPEATGEQRSVIGVKLNIFEAKASDAKGPPKAKKKPVRLNCKNVDQ